MNLCQTNNDMKIGKLQNVCNEPVAFDLFSLSNDVTSEEACTADRVAEFTPGDVGDSPQKFKLNAGQTGQVTGAKFCIVQQEYTSDISGDYIATDTNPDWTEVTPTTTLGSIVGEGRTKLSISGTGESSDTIFYSLSHLHRYAWSGWRDDLPPQLFENIMPKCWHLLLFFALVNGYSVYSGAKKLEDKELFLVEYRMRFPSSTFKDATGGYLNMETNKISRMVALEMGNFWKEEANPQKVKFIRRYLKAHPLDSFQEAEKWWEVQLMNGTTFEKTDKMRNDEKANEESSFLSFLGF